MRLRPSTPLSVLLFIALAFLVLSVITTPIIKAIPLGEFKGYTFGVFGFCKDNDCSDIGIGYKNLDDVLSDNNSAFDLPSGVRETLSTVLILHPIAAGLVLIMFIMAVTSHFHSPAHSTRFLLAFFIFNIITILVCLAAFLIDVLMFVPNIAWGSWIVLASTILVALSAVVTCAMRRSLISRKDRRRLVAENAEMSGDNFYAREGASKPVDFLTPAATIPLTTTATNNTGSARGDNLPAFATFEDQKKDDQVSDERVPLTQNPSSSSAGGISPPRPPPPADRYGNPMNNDGYGVARNPTRGPPPQAYRGRGGPYGGGGRGGYDMYGPPMRGRGGGYGRGGYPPRGRGGFGPPPRGGYGPRRGGPPPGAGYYDRRQPTSDPYGPPQRGYSNDEYNTGDNGYGANNLAPAAVAAGAATGAAAAGALPPSMSNSSSNYEPYNPDGRASDLPRAESPPAMGPGEGAVMAGGAGVGAASGAGAGAVEMDGTPVAPERSYTPYGGNNNNSNNNNNASGSGELRDNDSDIAGMVGLQQGRVPQRTNTYMSDGSRYSTDDQYHPARAAWNQDTQRTGSPLNAQNNQSRGNLPHSGSGNYYEDVDPRFESPKIPQAPPPQAYQQQGIPPDASYEDVHALNNGARSPAESEHSTFTSISQRGINPYWQPGPGPNMAPMPLNFQQGGGGNGVIPARRPVAAQAQQRQDMILDNPDFQLPGASGAPRAAGAAAGGRMPPTTGAVPGSAYPGI